MTFEVEQLGESGTELASLLRDLRKRAGLSGDRLAARCNMSQSKVSRIENGRTRPSLVDVEQILRALDAPPALVAEVSARFWDPRVGPAAPADTVPRQRIVGGLSSVITRYRGGTNIESEYYDTDGRSLTLGDVIDDVVRSDGFLYGADKINYKVRAGAVVGFAISGPYLSHFAHLTSYEEFLTVFGQPDRIHENEAYGDLMSYETYYWGARKHVTWDAWEDRVSFINLGDFEGNSGP